MTQTPPMCQSCWQSTFLVLYFSYNTNL